MNKLRIILLAVALPLLFCAGCASHYSIRLSNGEVITAKGKPHYDKDRGVWLYTDARGQPSRVPAGNVVEVSPSSMADSDNPNFVPTPQR